MGRSHIVTTLWPAQIWRPFHVLIVQIHIGQIYYIGLGISPRGDGSK
jgi:hypothetical protein